MVARGTQIGIVGAVLAALAVLAAPGASQPEPDIRAFETLCTPGEALDITGMATVGDTIYASIADKAGIRVGEFDTAACRVLSWVDLPGTSADIEAVGGRAPGASPHVWLSDAGVNRRGDGVTLIRLNTRTGASDPYRLTLGGEPRDVHVGAVLIEADGRPVIIATESGGRATLYAPGDGRSVDRLSQDLPLSRIGRMDLSGRGASPFPEVVVGGAVNSDGTVAAVRTSEFVYLFGVHYDNVADGLADAPLIAVPIPPEVSGEAVTFTADGDLLLGSVATEHPAPILVFRDASELASPLRYFEPSWQQEFDELLGVWAIELAPFWFILGSFAFVFTLTGIVTVAIYMRPTPTSFAPSFQDLGLRVVPLDKGPGVARMFRIETETGGEVSSVTVQWFGPAGFLMRTTHAACYATLRTGLNALVLLATHGPFNGAVPLLAIGTRFEWAARAYPPPLGTHRRPVTFDTFAAEWVWCDTSSAPDDRDAAILYFHGGGFVSCGLNTHRRLVARIARTTEVPVLNIAYRQLPGAHLTDAVDDGLTAYRHLLNAGFAPERILLAGDSTGAGLAFAVALTARDIGLPVPGAIIGLSPWADYDSSARLAHANNRRDPVLSAQALAVPVRWGFAPDGAIDPRWSPVNHDFTALPPILLQAGSTEVLLADVEQLARRCAEAHIPCTVQIWDRAIHVFQGAADLLPEARYAIGAIGAFAQRTLRPAPPEESEIPELSAAP